MSTKKKIILSLWFFVFSLAFLNTESRAEYYGSRTSNRYHYKTCRWFPLILPAKLLVFQSPEEAAESGYIPCPACRPPKPQPPSKNAAVGKPQKPAISIEKKEPTPPVAADEPANHSKIEKQAAKPPLQGESGRSVSADGATRIYGIKFDPTVDGMEKVVIYLDRFYIPEIRISEGSKSVIEIHFQQGTLVPDPAPDFATGGNFVKKIKIQRDGPVNDLRVVLEIEPHLAFLVNPVIYKAENIYLLEITKLKTTSLQSSTERNNR